ncbi:MAG: hypothetical protein Q9162_006028 [Coniocarpon cinnabarinum]
MSTYKPPPGPFTTLLWTTGLSLLHSGVAINSREYSFGGHDTPNLTGVYHNAPGCGPPGSTHRHEIVHGFTILTAPEIDAVIKTASRRFLGSEWNLLEKNCNHFTSYLCLELTGMEAPSWLNRAARVGVRLPCLLPREVVGRVPIEEEGVLEEEEESDEEVGLLGRMRSRESALVEDESEVEEQEEQGRGGGSEYTSESEEEEEEARRSRMGDSLRPPLDTRRSSGKAADVKKKKKSSVRDRDIRDTDGRLVPAEKQDPATVSSSELDGGCGVYQGGLAELAEGEESAAIVDIGGGNELRCRRGGIGEGDGDEVVMT